MPENKKISQLTEFSTTLENFPSLNIMVPIVKDGSTNYKLDLAALISQLKSAIAEISSSEEGDSEQSGQETDSQTLQTINNRLTTIESEILSLKTPNNYPKNYIRLQSGSNSYLYELPSGYNASTNLTAQNPLVIQTSNIVLPDFYATIGISRVSLNNGVLAFHADVDIYSVQGSIVLNGGTIGNVVITGGIDASDGAHEIQAITIDKTNVDLPKLEGDDLTHEPIDQLITVNLNTGVTINTIYVTCSISDKALGARGTYVQSASGGNSSTGSGQIYLNS